MTKQLHPMIPPTELIKEWMSEFYAYGATPLPGELTLLIATRAAQWGADQELEACLCEVSFLNSSALADRIRSKRRSKPQSLKEQALKELDLWDSTEFSQETLKSLFKISCDTIRKALEALPDD